ncbi:MAG: XisH family protein [Tolypothrix carrinoi HA7290-LM1]|jgi:hypothetical protein|nr:XisH family protein [Tolypothrix carrinoi HA7290-LM1]
MPARDTIHEIVKQAIIKDGWNITDDPYVISYGDRFLFVDLGIQGRFIGAERENSQIAIEIKEFRGRSALADLEQAIGQYVLYRLLLKRVDPEREIYRFAPGCGGATAVDGFPGIKQVALWGVGCGEYLEDCLKIA